MQVVASVSGTAAPQLGRAQQLNDDCGVNFYRDAPNCEVTVREFEELTRDRLKVLHAFDRLCKYDQKLEDVPGIISKIGKDLREAHLLFTIPPPGTTAEAYRNLKADFVRKDAISHFALRLAFCKTRDAREWFLRQEQRLFVLRFDMLRAEAQEVFLKQSGATVRKVSLDEKIAGGEKLVEFLQPRTPGAKIFDGDRPRNDYTFYEMPFFDVSPHLISARRVVVLNGKAYVPQSAVKTIISKMFKDELNHSLDVAFQGLPVALADPRVGGFLKDMSTYGMQLLVAPQSSSEDVGEKLSLGNFEEMLTRSMPPCFRRVVETQRETKKRLKHAGKLMLRPFLKECGFTMDESMKWWKQELCRDPEVDAASFEKNYMYDVEHTYGKKGHLQGQNAFGCPKIISFPAEAAGQCHGCFFKQLEMPLLKQQLHKWKVPQNDIFEIEKLIANGKHHQLACVQYFTAMHPGHSGDGLGNAPGQFFSESCKHHAREAEKKKERDGKTLPPKAM